MTAMIKLRHQTTVAVASRSSRGYRGVGGNRGCGWWTSCWKNEQLLDTVYEAQGERHPQSRSRGRMQTPAEVALRLLLLKHIRKLEL